nr:DnaJ family domain-containing protein [Ardenticatena sp.]
MSERHLSWLRRIEDAIRRAFQQGDFDDLRGTGQPLSDTHSDYYAGEHDLANRVLGALEMPPEFITMRREIEAEVAAARHALRAAVRRRERLLDQMNRARLNEIVPLHREAWDSWYAAVATFHQQARAINRKVEIFNLKNPIPNLFYPPLRIEEEIERAEQEVLREVGHSTPPTR